MSNTAVRVSFETYMKIAPAVYAGTAAVSKAIHDSGLADDLAELVKIRASQINGCAFCLQHHLNAALKLGVDPVKLDLVAVWHDAGIFSPREAAAAPVEAGADRRLVDLPGYGYAKVPLDMREHWKQEIDAYLHRRRSLRGLVLIVDIRHPLKEFDRLMLQFCADTGLPCHVLLTKADKLSRGAGTQALAALRKQFAAEGLHASAQVFSSSAGTGVDEAREAVANLLRQPRAAT